MNRKRYLKETSEALRKNEDEREEARLELLSASLDAAGAKALDRFTKALRAADFEHNGELWHCPSCRSQDREPEFVLELKVAGKHVEMFCSRGCRPNTIRSLLGAPPYFPTLGRARSVGTFPFR